MTRRIYFFISFLSSLFFATRAFAANVNIYITPPGQGIRPTTPIGLIISNMITIFLILGVIAVLFMFALGAFEWITSGGDKDAVSKARGRIMNAIIGLVILALSFLLSSVAGSVVGINLTNSVLPSLESSSPLCNPTTGGSDCP